MRRIKTFILLFIFIFMICPWARADDMTTAALLASSDSGVIDLGGKIITVSDTYTFSSNDKLIIKNGTINSTNNAENPWLTINSGGSITLSNDLTINRATYTAIKVTSGELIIEGATVKHAEDATNTWDLVWLNGSNASMVMNSGLLSTSYDSTLCVDTSATATINGGTILTSGTATSGVTVGYCAAYSASNGKIILNDGKIISTTNGSALVAAGPAIVEINGGEVSSTSGAALAAHSHSSTTINGFAYIKGGTFYGKDISIIDNSGDRVPPYYNVDSFSGSKWNPGQVKVSAGQFSSTDVKAYTAPGYVVVASSDLYAVVKDSKVTTEPTVSEISEGQTLNGSTFTNGTVRAVTSSSDITSTDVNGVWSWKDATIKPTFLDSDSTEYEAVFIPEDINIKSASIKLTVTVNIPSETGIKAVSVDDNGMLSYDIEANHTATLAKVLYYLKKSPDVTMIPINDKISSVDKGTLNELSKLVSIDFSGASQFTSVDLSGVTKIETVEISNNTTITSIDVSGCTELKTLNASGAGLVFVNVKGCSALTTFDVSDNNLLFLDLTDLSNLTGKWSGQTNKTSFTPTTEFDLGNFIAGEVEGVELASIDSVVEINKEDGTLIQTADYDTSTGKAKFKIIPTNYLRYYYRVFGNDSTSMDVTLKGNGNTFSDNVTSVAIDDYGNLTYTINGTETLANVLTHVDADSVKTIAVNSTISAVSNTDLQSLTNLESLDFSGASLLTALDLSGVTQVKTVEISVNKTIKTINVSNCTGLKTLDAKEVGATSVNVSGCTALEKLDVTKNNLTALDVSSCTSLKELYASGNNLVMLDLTKFNTSSLTGEWGGQTYEKEFSPLNKFNLGAHVKSLNPSAQIAYISSVSEVNGTTTVQTAEYDTSTGIATFTTIPKYDLRYYYKVFGDDSSTMDVTLSGNTNTSDLAIESVAVDSSGGLSYNIASGKTATLDEVLSYIDTDSLADVTTLAVNSQITKVNSEDLKKLTRLESLDLSSATGLTTTTIELNGTTVKALTLSENSNVSVISAYLAGNLKTIDFGSNVNLTSVDISYSGVTVVDVSGCTKLKALNAKGNKAYYVSVNGCDSLEELNVSYNRLLFLDLSDVSDTLIKDKCDFSHQKEESEFTSAQKFDLAGFILQFFDLEREDIAGYIANVSDFDEDNSTEEQTAVYNTSTGIATFTTTPVYSIKYYYKVSGDTVSSMDVTLSGNTNKDKEITDSLVVEVDDYGELDYTITSGTATLDEVLNMLDSSTLSSIKTVVVNNKISSVSNAALIRLLNLENLDLTTASALTNNLLDLSGVTANTVEMSANTAITSLKLSAASKVSHINAGGARIRDITLASNENIEELILDDTLISKIDASGCKNLKTLSAPGIGATYVNVQGCDALEVLDVSNNSLLFLDLRGLKNLSEGDCDWSGQAYAREFRTSSSFDLGAFILRDLSADVKSVDIIGNITLVSEIDSQDKEVQAAVYDKKTGIASFKKTPTNDLIYYYKVFGDVSSDVDLAADDDIDETWMDVILFGNESTPTSDEIKIQGVSVDISTGELSYKIADGQKATLDEILNELDADSLASITTLPINSQISSVSNTALKKLTLEKLDLTNASGLTNTTLDLDGVTIDTVVMSGSTALSTLKLTAASNVSHINASGAPLTAVDLNGNETIETLDISETYVTELNASGCSNLQTLNANNASLSSVNLKDCDSLETLDVAKNSLLVLDLTGLSSLTSGDWSGQTYVSFKPASVFDLAKFILGIVADNLGIESSDIVGNISDVKEVDANGQEVQSSNYDKTTGIARFGKIPTNDVKYYYKVLSDDVNDDSDENSALTADTADELPDSMDVILTGNENDPTVAGSSVVGPSNAGCNSSRGEGLGIRSVLLFLAMFIFACAKTKRL